MQSVLIRKPCQRAHERGQEEVIAVCLNKACQNRLCCVNCQREHPKDHLTDLWHFDFLPANLEKELCEYKSLGILNLINQKKQQFTDAKAGLIKIIDLLEEDFFKNISRVSEADQLVRESIQMVDNKDYLLFKEIQAQALCALRDTSFANRLKKIVVQPIIQEIQTITMELKNKLESTRIENILKLNVQDPLWIETFQNYRPMKVPLEMKLIIEDSISQLNNDNLLYQGGIYNNLKHGRGILIKRDHQEIQEGVWEQDNMKWGLKLVNNQIYVGQFKNDKMEGMGIHKNCNDDHYEGQFENNVKAGKGFEKYSNGDCYEGNFSNDRREGNGIYRFQNGDIYEGQYKNGKMEGQGIYKYSNGEIEVGQYFNNVSVGEHKVFKQASPQPLKINIYGRNGNLQEVKQLE